MLYFVSAYIVMRYIKFLDIFIYLSMAIIPFVYHLFVYLFGVCFAGFVCSLYLFAKADYTCIWSVTCSGVQSLTTDVVWIEYKLLMERAI